MSFHPEKKETPDFDYRDETGNRKIPGICRLPGLYPPLVLRTDFQSNSCFAARQHCDVELG